MFNYGTLNEIEKQIILLIGDHIKVPPLEAYTRTKNREKLFLLTYQL